MINSIRVFLVDDEDPSRNALKVLISQLSLGTNLDIVGEARTPEEAIERIKAADPDILFLDIQLHDQTSFSILDQLNHNNYEIIFVTAYSEYAIKAFQFSAADYLLKPVNPIRLKEAIQKVADRLSAEKKSSMLDVLMDNLSLGSRPKKIVLSTADMVHVVELDAIIKCQSSVNYTIFYLTNGKELIISRTLKEFDDQLSGNGFFRVHRSWLINEEHIIGYDKREGGYVVMSDQTKLPVSSMKRDELMKLIKHK